MKKVLFIFNGLVKSGGKVGVSGGDIRLFEIMKNSQNIEKNILTTPNGFELIEKFGINYNVKYIINYNVSSGIISNLVISLKSFFGLPKELKKFNGIVYSSCEHLYDVFPALKMKLLNGCTWYAVYHWVEDYPWKEKRGNTPFLIRYVYWLNRWFSGFLIKLFSDKILAVSDQTKEKLINIKIINNSKIKAVYCGVNYLGISAILNKYKNEFESEFDAVFMKRLNYGKGVNDLLKIWKKVCDVKKDAKLAIIGDGPESVLKEVNNFILEHNLEKNIKLFGVIYDFEEKFRILNKSKLFLLPSHEENWAIVIGEAMAIKKPVIAYALKEIIPIWKDNVEWVPFLDYDKYANVILEYLNNNNKRIILSEKAYTFIKDYDWKEISQNEFNI